MNNSGLLLRKEIYSSESINHTIAAYEGFAEFTVIDGGEHIIVTFNNCKYDEERTVKEFENYLIGLENI